MLDEGLSRATALITNNRQLVENLRDRLLNVKALSREQVLEVQQQTLGA
jgi:ATP-dependent Zn protease